MFCKWCKAFLISTDSNIINLRLFGMKCNGRGLIDEGEWLLSININCPFLVLWPLKIPFKNFPFIICAHLKICLIFHSYPHVHITKINNLSFCQINSVLFFLSLCTPEDELGARNIYIYRVKKKIFIFLIFLLVKHHQIQPNIILTTCFTTNLHRVRLILFYYNIDQFWI